jgi:hypothetical protein
VVLDGAATVGIIVMSVTSPLLCLGTKWKLLPPVLLPKRNGKSCDVVTRTRQGAFTVVHL